MNLGAFLDPAYPIFSTTLCYLERDDAYLMLHRVKKQDDYNHDKWVGVGGKFERFESPEECLVREVREETGLTLTRYRARGLLTFVLGNMTEFIHLFTADGWEGEMLRGDACREGVLEWVPKEKVDQLPIWEGDKLFFRLFKRRTPLFFAQARLRRRHPHRGRTGRQTHRIIGSHAKNPPSCRAGDFSVCAYFGFSSASNRPL